MTHTKNTPPSEEDKDLGDQVADLMEQRRPARLWRTQVGAALRTLDDAELWRALAEELDRRRDETFGAAARAPQGLYDAALTTLRAVLGGVPTEAEELEMQGRTSRIGASERALLQRHAAVQRGAKLLTKDQDGVTTLYALREIARFPWSMVQHGIFPTDEARTISSQLSKRFRVEVEPRDVEKALSHAKLERCIYELAVLVGKRKAPKQNPRTGRREPSDLNEQVQNVRRALERIDTEK